MGFVKKGAAAFGKLFIVVALAATFGAGLVGVVYMRLQGKEMKVPEIVGKDFVESEKELQDLGLVIKKRADRYSNEKPNTVLEQLPKAGETVKTGQMILVVTSKTNPEGQETPATIKKNTDDEDDSSKIEDLISDKPKKSKTNTNSNTNKKKSSTTRDVLTDDSNTNSNSESAGNSSNSNKSNSNKSNSNSGANKNTSTNSNKSNTNVNKAVPAKPVSGGDVRPRKTPQP